MWDSQTLQCMKTLEGHEDNVRVLAVGDRQVFSGSWDKTIRVWDLDTLECSKVGQWTYQQSFENPPSECCCARRPKHCMEGIS